MPARVLGQLLIDLSWSSSHLEGNSKSLLDTKELFERGEQTGPMDEDSLMLPNHKNAIESIIDRVRQIRNPVPDGHSKCSTYGQSNCSTPGHRKLMC